MAPELALCSDDETDDQSDQDSDREFFLAVKRRRSAPARPTPGPILLAGLVLGAGLVR